MTLNKLPISIDSSEQDLVHWANLEATFSSIYKRTIEDVLENQIRARVLYCGIPFLIIPHREGFAVMGAPALNRFPSQVFVV
jgi:hypothetical protein